MLSMEKEGTQMLLSSFSLWDPTVIHERDEIQSFNKIKVAHTDIPICFDLI